MVKKLSYLVLGILIILILVMLSRIYIGDKASVLLDKKPTEIFLYDKNNVEYIIRQDDAYDVISKIHDHISKKTTKRVSDYKAEEFINNSIVKVEYGYKGKILFIDNQGKILISIYDSEIRNKSSLRWLCWKMDNIINKNSKVGIYYLTKSDDDMINLINLIKNKSNEFSKLEAISKVIEKHPEFPDNTDVVKIKEINGGGKPPGLRFNIEFSTSIEKIDKETYIVTIKKDWKYKVGNNYVISYWKYKVTPKDLILIDSQDRDDWSNLIK